MNAVNSTLIINGLAIGCIVPGKKEYLKLCNSNSESRVQGSLMEKRTLRDALVESGIHIQFSKRLN